MKKRILSIMLTLLMLVSILPITPALASEAVTLQGSGTQADPWILTKEVLDSHFYTTDLDFHYYRLSSGYYRLDENITVENTIQIKGTVVTLDLNGYELQGINFEKSSLQVSTNCTLTIVDSSPKKTGKVSNANTAVELFIGSILNADNIPFYGNIYSNGTINSGIFYGAVYVATINGGIFYNENVSGLINDSAKVTVTFDSNGGSKVDEQKVLRGQKISSPTTQRDGCTFDGWYEKADGKFKEAPFDFANTHIIENITLYAKWECPGHTDENPKDNKCDICGEALKTDSSICEIATDVYDSIQAGDYASAIGGTVELVKSILTMVHSLVHQLSLMFDFHCPFCDTSETVNLPIPSLKS